MPSRNDRLRNAKRARAPELPLDALYVAPPGLDEHEYFIELDDPDFQVIQRFVYDEERRVVEFALILVKMGYSRFREIYSIDTEHGYLHEHIYGHSRPDDRRDIKPLFSQGDVAGSFDDAYSRVLKHYDELE